MNLYLRPPGVSGWVAPLTPNRVDALVRRAHRYACGAIADSALERAASAERVRDANAARAEAQDLAESRGAFHLGSPVRAPPRGHGRRDPVRWGRRRDLSARGDDDPLAAARGGARGTKGTREPNDARDRVRWRRRRTTPDDSGSALRCTSEPAGAPREPRTSQGARRPEGLSAAPPQPPGHQGLPPRESGMDWSGKRRRRSRRDAPVSSSSYDTAGSTHVFERRLVLRVHRPPPRRGVRAPNDDE